MVLRSKVARAGRASTVLASVALPAMIALTGCGGDDDPVGAVDPCAALGEVRPCVSVAPGDESGRRLQRALLEAAPGQVVLLGAGVFDVEAGLSLAIDGVAIRGRGIGATVLQFGKSAGGGPPDGLVVKAVDGFTLEDLSVRDTVGDAVRVEKSRNVVLRRVEVEWTGGPSQFNGLYGLYPIGSSDVVVEDNVVRGAADAGIYVGESDRIIVRRNSVSGNSVGIQIENSNDVDVLHNEVIGNSAGVSAFNIPGRLVNKSGRRVRVGSNRIADNNLPAFAHSDNPVGVGVAVVAAQEVEVFGNEIAGHQLAGVAILSFELMRRSVDPDFYPHSHSISMHGNEIQAGAFVSESTRTLSRRLGLAIGSSMAPEIVYDGRLDRPVPEAPPGNPGWVCARDNGEASIELLAGLADEEADRLPIEVDTLQCDGVEVPAVELSAALDPTESSA